MNLLEVNKRFIEQRLPGLDTDYAVLADELSLDPAYLQLLNDCYTTWRDKNLPGDFWLYLLLLVDEVNRGSSCLKLTSKRFKQHQKRFNLLDWAQLAVNLTEMTLAEMPVIVDHNQCLYFEKYYHAEQVLQQQIHALLHAYQGHQYTTSDIKKVVERVLKNQTYPLNQEQIQALITGLLQPFSLISGGPGTGKTTTLSSLLQCLYLLGIKVEHMALAAPTGRAAYRMTASLQTELKQQPSQACDALLTVEAQTIYRLIGKSQRFNQPNRYHNEHKLPHQVIVIDEVSMVDLQLMTELLAAVDLHCRLILVGDQFQLPSVESGAVLADLMPPQHHRLSLSQEFAAILTELMATFVENPKVLPTTTDHDAAALLADNCTVLRQSHRSIQAIQNISECVRLGDSEGFFKHPDLTPLTSKNIEFKPNAVMWMPPYERVEAGLAFIWHWFKHHVELSEYHKNLQRCLNFDHFNISACSHQLDAIFKHINQQQILTLINRGVSGQEDINQYLSQQLKKQWQIEADQKHFHGQVVMMQRNDYDKQLFNGDIGVILYSREGWYAVFPGTTGYRAFAVHLLPELVTAFAITVHKSQGSEYRHVLIPLPTNLNNSLLTREIIYTGMTRAKSSVCFIGSEAVLSKAIEKHTERQSGLQFW